MIDEISKIAKEILLTDGYHSPQVHFYLPDNQKIIMVLKFNNNEQKEKMLELIKDTIQEKKVDKYFVIMEAWMGTNVLIRPSNLPSQERKECLMVIEYNRNMINQQWICVFRRENDKIIIEGEHKCRIDNSSSASIWNAYTEDVMEERMEKSQKEIIEKFCNTLTQEEKLILMDAMQNKEINGETINIMLKFKDFIKGDINGDFGKFFRDKGGNI